MDRANGVVERHQKTVAATGPAYRRVGTEVSGLAGHISGLGDVFGVMSRRQSMFLRGWAALNVVTGVAESAVAALTVNVAALATGLTAGALGLGAYGVAAVGVTSQLRELAQAQKTAFAPGATAESMAKYREQLAKLSPPLREFWTQLQAVRKDYEAWAKDMQRPVLAPMSAALKLVHPLLKDMGPFVREASSAMTTLIEQLGRGIRSTGFQEWLATMLPLVRPVILGIGRALGNIAVGIGGIMRAFAPFARGVIGSIEDITARFAEWGQTLSGHTGFQALIEQWRRNWPVMREGLRNLAAIVGNIVKNMAGMLTPANSRLMWQIANPLLSLAARLTANPALVQAFFYLLLIGRGAGKIKSVFDALKTGWGTFAGIISKLTGGRISLGMQGAGDTMLLASRNMQTAANTMIGASRGAGGVGILGGGPTVGQAKKAGWAGRLRTIGSWAGSIAGGAFVTVMATQIAGAFAPDSPEGRQIWKQAKGVDWAKQILVVMFGSEENAQNVTGLVGSKVGRWVAGGLVTGIVRSLTEKGGKLSKDLPGMILGWFSSQKLSGLLATAGTGVIGGFIGGMRSGWVKQGAAWLGEMPKRILGFFSGSRGWLLGIGTGIMGGLSGGLTRAWPGISAWMRGRKGQLLLPFTGAIGWLSPSGRGLIEGLWNGIRVRFAGVSTWMGGMPGRVGGWFRGALSWLRTAGWNVLQGLWNGMISVWRKIEPWVTGLAGWIARHKGPIAFDQRLLFPAGRALMGGLYDGLISGWKKVWTLVGGVAVRIGEAFTGPGPGYPAAAGHLVAYAQRLLAAYGWANQWRALNAIIVRESGWRVNARNPTSGAYGLGQALPPSKMAPYGRDYLTSGYTQLRWMLAYIRQRYGNPNNAWRFWQAHNWYDQGGPISEAIWGLGLRTGETYGFRAGEQVQTAAQSRTEEKLLAEILRELRALNATTQAAPGRTAAGVARAARGPSHLAAQNAVLGAR